MTDGTFRGRMEFIARKNYPVLYLGDALARMESGTLPSSSTIITFDDGWYGTYSKLIPILRAHGFPATLYITTYYVEKRFPVFNMLVGYLLWRGRNGILDLGRIVRGLEGKFDLSDPSSRSRALDRICVYAASELDAPARQELAERIGAELGCDMIRVRERRLFELVDGDNIHEMASDEVDIQLHTHRHRFPVDDREGAEREIHDNSTVLRRYVAGEPVHFCYPSGEYELWQIPWLEQLGIQSATTTNPGFNNSSTSPYLLNRFLDSETVSLLEFEAELCGFFELIRRTLGIRI
jgi:hypothetical protein